MDVDVAVSDKLLMLTIVSCLTTMIVIVCLTHSRAVCYSGRDGV